MRLTPLGPLAALLLAAPAARPDAPPAGDEAADLVGRLGSPRFADREAAAQKLVALGGPGKPALRAGAAGPDPEVAERCRAVLARVRAAEREAFAAGKADWPGPVAKRFRELVGDTEGARQLFAAALASDGRATLLETIDDTPAALARAYAGERKRVEGAAAKAALRFRGQPFSDGLQDALRQASREAVEPGDVILVLFLGAVGPPGDGKEPDRRAELLSASFIDLARGPLKEPFARLFLAWLDRQTDPAAVAGGLDGALYAPIPAAADRARRVLADPKASGPAAGKALLVLGHHGAAADLPLLGRFRNDERAASEYVRRDKARLEVQVRDLAAAMSLTLRGEDPNGYGFEAMPVLAWWCGPKEAPCKTLGYFDSARERDEAQRKAWAWLDERAKRDKK